MKRALLPLILLTSLLSCTDDLKFNNIHVNVNTSIPAGALNYTDQSLLALSELGKILTVNKDNILSVVYKDKMNLIANQDISRFFTFPEQNMEFNYQLTPTRSLGNIDAKLEIPLALRGFKNGEIIDRIVFGNGSVSLNIDNIPASELNGIIWELPQLTDSKGNIITGKPGQAINLAGVSMNPLDNNTLNIVVKGKFPITTSIQGNLNISSDKFTSVTGWLGRRNIDIDPIDAQFGNDFQEFNKYVGQAYFANPTLALKINNSVGVPTLLIINKIAIGNSIVNLKPGLGSSKFLIDANTETTITLNNSMTVGGEELSLAINPKATNVRIALSAVINPTLESDNVESEIKTNHISDKGKISGEYIVELPMDGYFKDIMFEEKVSSVNLKTDNIKYENFVMAFTGANAMPLDIELNGYAGAVESKNQLFDKPALIPSATSSTQPYKIGKENMIAININKESIDKLIKNKDLMFRFKASTRGADKKERVKFYSPTSIKLNIFMGVKAEIY